MHTVKTLKVLQLIHIGAFLIIIIGLNSGCMPLNDHNVNTDLFETQEAMKTKTSDLKPGMKKSEAFEILGVPMEKFNQLGTVEIQMALYGNSQLQGTPKELEQFRKKMMMFEGFSLPYTSIKSGGSIGFGKMKVKKTGHNLVLILLFENGKLLRATVEGQQQVNEKEDQYFWNSILKTGVKAAI